MTFFVYSLGCKVNSYECAAVSAILMREGYIEDKNNPDIIIINTCSVTHVADRKSRQHIRKYKSMFPKSIIVVMGCFAQGNLNVALDECGADIVIGTSRRSEIPLLIDKYKESKKPQIFADKNPREFFSYEELGVTAFNENVRAYLKIQDGCDNFCSYCIVPYRRGKSRSRAFNDVICEAKSLIKLGFKEIVLTGIHVGGYGKDIGHTFDELVESLINLPGEFRIRISSIEESEITENLITLMANSEKLAKHFHIPLQSGSDYILKKMARKYTAEQFKTTCLNVRKLIPDVCLTTDVIVGFPGETEDDFNCTFNLIKECTFNQLHVFPYSIREGTGAAIMPDQISPKIKDDRVNTLLKLSEQLWKDYSIMQEGKEVKVLIENIDNKTCLLYGHSENYLDVYLPRNAGKPGDLVKVKYKNLDAIRQN